MATLTIGDMLDRAEDFENRLEAYYNDLREHSTRNGTRLLVYYLARHRRHLPEALSTLSEAQLRHVRAVLLKYDDTDFSPKRLFAKRTAPPSMTGEELLDVSIELVEALIHFYQWVADQPIGPEAKALFESLLRIEERHVVELKKMKAMDYF